VVRQLKAGTKGEPNKDIEETGDFWFDEKDHLAALTEQGVHRVEQLLRIPNLYEPDMLPVNHAVGQALVARHLKKADVEYVVKTGEKGRPEVVIVDEFTGRLMPGRRWSDGLHQAVEAKEGIAVQSENQTLASITFQNYFRMYDKLGGMTGTADTEAPEFAKIYDLDVLVVPTNSDMVRDNLPDVIYKTVREKHDAVIEDIRERHETGQPVLVGTIAIETSELFAKKLKRAGVPHNVLNAKHHEREAEIVAQAGRAGAVTISTNMAGRGTDIVLGGNAEAMALAKCGGDRDHPEFAERLATFETACAEERGRVLEAGGLHILGTERHESRRIDNQLRGRSGRQGDPGSSRFYLSLEDNLLRLFGSERITGWMERLGLEDGEAIEHRFITRAIENAQQKVESRNFDVRKHLLEYDDVMNKQRQAFYGRRRALLAGEEGENEIPEMVEGIVVALLEAHWPEKDEPDAEMCAALATALDVQFGTDFDPKTAPFTTNGTPLRDRDAMGRGILDALLERLRDRAERWDGLCARYPAAGLINFQELEREVLLRTLDRLWKDHLLSMDTLRDGVRFRGYAQRDPKVEYAREGFALFEEMNERIDLQTTEELYKVWVDEARLAQLQESAPPAGSPLVAPANEHVAPAAAQRRGKAPKAGKVGRNDLCPCGSGKKYKRCCGA
jgi:preprotein translocase subunit SecA